MNLVFSRIESMSQSQEHNIFRIFQCEAIRRGTPMAIEQDFPPNLYEVGQKIKHLVASWFSNPTEELVRQIVKHLKIECTKIRTSHTTCTATQIGLLVALVGAKGEKLTPIPFRNEDSNQLLQTIEHNANYLNQPDNQDQFVAYGIDLYGSLSEETKHIFGGHSLTIVQYSEIGLGVRYRLFQSFLNKYDLSDNIKNEKEKHQVDGSFSHESCLTLIKNLERLLDITIWNEESNVLCEELFGVSAPELIGKNINVPCLFRYKIGSQQKFHLRNDKLMLISEQMKRFLKTITVTDDVYIQLLRSGFEPCCVNWKFYV
jgi:hypothetical protein